MAIALVQILEVEGCWRSVMASSRVCGVSADAL